MDDIRSSRHLLVFFSFTLVLHRTTTESYSLQYLYTAVTKGTTFPGFMAVGLVNGEIFVSYNSSTGDMIPKSKWVQDNSDDQYFKKQTIRLWMDEGDLKNHLSTVMDLFNHSAGVHTLQRMYGCELDDDDGSTGGHDRFGYDGEDLISLDLNTTSWTAAHGKAVIIKDKWEADGYNNEQKFYLEETCIEGLKNYISFSKETPERKVPPVAQVFHQQQHSSTSVLVCHATGFFPKAVNLTWQKDGEKEERNVDTKETLPNHDGSFQKRIILRVSPVDLQKNKYTCVIQHSSLKEDLMLPVTNKKSGGDINQNLHPILIFGVVMFALLMLYFFAAFYKIYKSDKCFKGKRKSILIKCCSARDPQKREEQGEALNKSHDPT